MSLSLLTQGIYSRTVVACLRLSVKFKGYMLLCGMSVLYEY